MNAKLRMELERRIAAAVIDGLLAAGYSITVNDDEFGNGEDVIKRSRDKAAILAVMFSTDGDLLIAIKSKRAMHFRDGWVSFIYGNSGYDVVHDYTTNLEAALKAANDLADSYS